MLNLDCSSIPSHAHYCESEDMWTVEIFVGEQSHLYKASICTIKSTIRECRFLFIYLFYLKFMNWIELD